MWLPLNGPVLVTGVGNPQDKEQQEDTHANDYTKPGITEAVVAA
jgi:hypothetical protein